ncbi:hypothetical protein D104_03430 [Marinomonas profundimaris]|uniref:Uncharacterized protein n=1 Tax=Marinomonas profundimaris TaxID=1208321 RepID=W1RXP4_9GAMM|nr:hypothetical protein D104_03430 [Marinomonas profundimaris]
MEDIRGGIIAPKSQSNSPSPALPLNDIRGGNVYVVGLNEVIDMNKTNTKSEVKRQCRAVVFGLLTSPAKVGIKAPPTKNVKSITYSG